MKSIYLVLCVLVLLGCSKNETPEDQTSPPPTETPSDPATAVITTVFEGQKRVIKVYNPDGSLRWSTGFNMTGGLSQTPTYSDGSLYANFGDSLFAFNIQTGALLWKKKYWTSAVQPPTAYKGVLYAPGELSLFELSPLDGSLLKRHAISQLLGFPVILKDSIVYLLTASGLGSSSLNAYDLRSRTIKWTTSIGLNYPIGLVLVGDNLIFRNDFVFNLKAIDIKTGQFSWIRNDNGYTQHVAYGDRIYAVPQGGSEYLNINAIDAKTGSRVWKWIQNKVTSGIQDIYVYKDQVNFMIHEPDRKLAYIAVKSLNGDSLWRKEGVYSKTVYSAQVAGDRLYRFETLLGGSFDSKVVIYDAKTFSPVDSTAPSYNQTFLFMKVIKKSDN